MSDVFPDLSAEQVEAAVAQRWDLSGPFPVPRGGWLRCPVCRCTTIQPRTWTRQVRVGHTITNRVDVSFKCTDCSCAWTHGVPVPEDYARRNARRPNEHIDWREVRAANHNATTSKETA